MNSSWMWVVVILLAVLSVSALLLWLRSRRNMEELERRLTALVSKQQNEISAVFDGTFGVGKQVQALARDVRDLRERQQRAEKSDPGELPYNQAMRMVESGADADQLVERCGLSRSEAELVVLLHEKSPPVIEPMKPDSSQMMDDQFSPVPDEALDNDPEGQTGIADNKVSNDTAMTGDTTVENTELNQPAPGQEKDKQERQQQVEKNQQLTEDEDAEGEVVQPGKRESSGSSSIERAEQNNLT